MNKSGSPISLHLTWYLFSQSLSNCAFFSLCLSDSNLKKLFPNNISLSFCVPYHWNSVDHKVFQYLFETIMGCLVPFCLINTCYSSVLCRLQSAKFQRRAKSTRLILLIICAFAIFWLPYHIVNIIEVIKVLFNFLFYKMVVCVVCFLFLPLKSHPSSLKNQSHHHYWNLGSGVLLCRKCKTNIFIPSRV